MAKKHVLKLLLEELQEQLQLVEPHQDAEIDLAAHQNAMLLLDYLKVWADGELDLRRICLGYFESKLETDIENFSPRDRNDK
jgi:hypothetical protein